LRLRNSRQTPSEPVTISWSRRPSSRRSKPPNGPSRWTLTGSRHKHLGKLTEKLASVEADRNATGFSLFRPQAVARMRLVFLDTGTLGMVANPRGSPRSYSPASGSSVLPSGARPALPTWSGWRFLKSQTTSSLPKSLHRPSEEDFGNREETSDQFEKLMSRWGILQILPYPERVLHRCGMRGSAGPGVFGIGGIR